MMKQFIFTLCLAVVAFSVGAQAQTQSCCEVSTKTTKATKSSTKSSKQPSTLLAMAALAGDSKFQALHEEPLPFVYEGGKGKAVTVKAADGSTCMGYEIKADKPTKNYVFVFQEWWGLNDYIKQESEKLAAALGANVIALDLYDGKVATTRDSAGVYMQNNKPERSLAIVKAFAAYTGADAKIGTIGWCFGGAWSLQSSLALGKQAVACVMYYGRPELDEKKLATLNPPVLGIFGKQDQGITPETVGKFEAAMKNVKKPIEIKMYDAVHAFANPSNPKYNKAFADEAHQLAVAFLKKHLI